MGVPFSRVLDVKMPRRNSLINVHNRPTNIPTTVSRVKSVFSLGKSKTASRHSQSHVSVSLPTVIQKTSQASSRHGSYHNSYVTAARISHNNRNTDVSPYPSQGSFSLQFAPRHVYTSSDYLLPSTCSTSRILVIEDMGNFLASSKSGTSTKSDGEHGESPQLLGKVSVNFDYMESRLEKLRNNDSSQSKAKIFVTAWRNGLSYPHTKKNRILTDIPTAATSHCKSGITSCKRFYRRHIKSRLGRASDENLLADLVHKESLEKFMEETEQFHATSSIVIREDLKRKLLFDSVHHADSAEKVEDKEKMDEDEDMKITVQFNVPPPVHIDYNPQQNLFEKDVQKMTELGLMKTDTGEVQPSFSVTQAHHHKHVALFKKRHSHK